MNHTASTNPLAQPAYRHYYTARTLTTIGNTLTPLALAYAALTTGGATTLGLTLAANRIPAAVLILAAGALADRHNRKHLLIAADVLCCASQVTTGLLLLTGQVELWSLMALQAAAGAGTALNLPTAHGLLPQLVHAEQLQQANAQLGLMLNTSRILGIAAAGTLVATSSAGTALLIDGIMFAASGIVLTSLRPPAPVRRAAAAESGFAQQLRDGARCVLRTPWLRTLLGYSALLQTLVIGPHMIAGPLLAAQLYDGASSWALIGIVQACGSIIGGTIALRWRPQRPLIAVVALSLAMVPYLGLYASGAALWLVTAAAAGMGAQGAIALTMQTTVLQQHVPDHARSRVGAWAQLGNIALLPVSLAVMGPIVATFGTQTIFAGAVCWILVSTGIVLCHPGIRALRKAIDEESMRQSGAVVRPAHS